MSSLRGSLRSQWRSNLGVMLPAAVIARSDCDEAIHLPCTAEPSKSIHRPDGQISKLLSGTLCKKYSAGAVGQIIFTRFAIPARQEGRIAIVTDVGLGCGGRRCAFDERH